MIDRYRYLVILLMIALPLSLAGCAEEQAGGGVTAQAPSSEAPNAAGADAGAEEQTDHTPSVDIRDGREEDLEEGACWQYTADEDGIYLVISPDDTVYSFKFVAVHVEEGLEYLIGDELYSVDELTPDKPFLVKMMFVGLLPTYGVVFEDANGCERLYTINAKGTGPEESYPYFLQEIDHWKRT